MSIFTLSGEDFNRSMQRSADFQRLASERAGRRLVDSSARDEAEAVHGQAGLRPHAAGLVDPPETPPVPAPVLAPAPVTDPRGKITNYDDYHAYEPPTPTVSVAFDMAKNIGVTQPVTTDPQWPPPRAKDISDADYILRSAVTSIATGRNARPAAETVPAFNWYKSPEGRRFVAENPAHHEQIMADPVGFHTRMMAAGAPPPIPGETGGAPGTARVVSATGAKPIALKDLSDFIFGLEGGPVKYRPGGALNAHGAMGPYQVTDDTASTPPFGIRPESSHRNFEERKRIGQEMMAAYHRHFSGDPLRIAMAWHNGLAGTSNWDGTAEGLKQLPNYGDATQQHYNRAVTALGKQSLMEEPEPPLSEPPGSTARPGPYIPRGLLPDAQKFAPRVGVTTPYSSNAAPQPAYRGDLPPVSPAAPAPAPAAPQAGLATTTIIKDTHGRPMQAPGFGDPPAGTTAPPAQTRTAAAAAPDDRTSSLEGFNRNVDAAAANYRSVRAAYDRALKLGDGNTAFAISQQMTTARNALSAAVNQRAVDHFEATGNPTLLAQILTSSTGANISIAQRTDGKYNVTSNGQTQLGLTKEQIVAPLLQQGSVEAAEARRTAHSAMAAAYAKAGWELTKSLRVADLEGKWKAYAEQMKSGQPVKLEDGTVVVRDGGVIHVLRAGKVPSGAPEGTPAPWESQRVPLRGSADDWRNSFSSVR